MEVVEDCVENNSLFCAYIMNIPKKIIYRFSIMVLVAISFFAYTRVFAFDEFSLSTVSAPLFDTLSSTSSVKNIVENYCTAVLSSSPFTQNDFVYNAQQSAFVHLLCSNAGERSSSFFSKSTYLTRTTFAQLWFETIVSDWSNEIEYCGFMDNECDLATNLPKLFNDIISDYVNMKQTNIYGLIWNFETEQDIEDQVNIFSSGYFDGIEFCKKTDRTYPKTCSMVKWYVKNARNLLSDVRIFNVSWLLAQQPWLVSCDAKNSNYNLLFCGLYGNSHDSFVPFVNLTYNELFYYRLFMSYYFISLQKNPVILIQSTQNNNLDTIVKKFSSEYMRSKNALSLTFRMLRDTNMAFPLHVGFSLYQEDINEFGKVLARIAPPIYTLYDKLRNVQTAQ